MYGKRRGDALTMKVKKSSSEIKEKIIHELQKGPKSVSEISAAINSNWITTERFLQGLKEDKKVNELVSTDKKKIYQLTTGETYFNIPLDEKIKSKFRTLFYLIIKTYKDKTKAIPTRTHLSKCAVEVINNPESELDDLPLIKYLYGMIPLMVADPSQIYNEEIVFGQKEKIEEIIKVYIKKNHNQTPKQLDKIQHKALNDELYQLYDNISEELNKNDINQNTLLDLLNLFFIACPIDPDFPEVFEYTDKFISTVSKLSSFENLNENKRVIFSSFEALWRFIATYNVYKSIERLNIIPAKMLLDFYIGNVLQARKTCFEESFLELYSIYLSKLSTKDIKLSTEAQKTRDILEGWTGED